MGHLYHSYVKLPEGKYLRINCYHIIPHPWHHCNASKKQYRLGCYMKGWRKTKQEIITYYRYPAFRKLVKKMLYIYIMLYSSSSHQCTRLKVHELIREQGFYITQKPGPYRCEGPLPAVKPGSLLASTPLEFIAAKKTAAAEDRSKTQMPAVAKWPNEH